MQTLVVSTPSIEVLAERIRANYTIAEASAAKMVEAMIAVGRDLMEARALVPEGKLNEWAKTEVGMHPKTVRTYIRFATHADLLREHQPNGTLEARKLLTQMGVPQINSADVLRQEAIRLKKEGLTQKEIAERLQVSRPRVSQYLNADKHKARDTARQRERQAAAKARARELQAKAVTKAGNKNAAEAYSLTRKALQELDRAFASTPENKHKYLRHAMEALYRAEDNIALAVNTD